MNFKEVTGYAKSLYSSLQLEDPFCIVKPARDAIALLFPVKGSSTDPASLANRGTEIIAKPERPPSEPPQSLQKLADETTLPPGSSSSSAPAAAAALSLEAPSGVARSDTDTKTTPPGTPPTAASSWLIVRIWGVFWGAITYPFSSTGGPKPGSVVPTPAKGGNAPADGSTSGSDHDAQFLKDKLSRIDPTTSSPSRGQGRGDATANSSSAPPAGGADGVSTTGSDFVKVSKDDNL